MPWATAEAGYAGQAPAANQPGGNAAAGTPNGAVAFGNAAQGAVAHGAQQGGPGVWGSPVGNQSLQPPADPWAGAAPLHHPPGSPWATPPGHAAHGAAPPTDHGQPGHGAVGSQHAGGHPGYAPGQHAGNEHGATHPGYAPHAQHAHAGGPDGNGHLAAPQHEQPAPQGQPSAHGQPAPHHGQPGPHHAHAATHSHAAQQGYNGQPGYADQQGYSQPGYAGEQGYNGQPAQGWGAFGPGQGEPATQPGIGQPPPVASPPQMPYQEQPPRAAEAGVPTAEEFARRRAVRPPDPVARTGVRAAVNKTTLGLVRLAPGRHEQEFRQDVEKVRRNFGGLRQVTVVNPKGGAGKTVAVLLLAMTFGQKRGGYVLAWDNNETQGTLGMRAQQDFHSRTVRDMLRDLSSFQGAHGRVGDLSQYVRSQGEGMFDVLASDESATAGEMLTAHAFGEIREVVSRFYKLIFVDTGNNVRAQNWQAAIDATDQLVLTMSARNDSAETAARMLDHLEQSGRTRLVRQAVTVVSMPSRSKEIDLPPIQRHFEARTRAVLLVPYDRQVDTGEPLQYGQLSNATLDAWLKVAAAVSEGL
ncbi:chromosome partitioning protein [Phytohabitans kaempferiae]|uniref:Chromosome partitioning protein n=1 Tax=Phytohabitans kaempferiae TaxID=1620943 RepID=A0ABV6LUN7_9ACTN